MGEWPGQYRGAHMWVWPKKGFKSGQCVCGRLNTRTVILPALIFSRHVCSLARQLETTQPNGGTHKRPGAQAPAHILYRLTSRPTRRVINFTHVNYSFLCVTSRARKKPQKKRDACVISKLGPDADFDHYSHNSVKHENRTFASQPGIKNALPRGLLFLRLLFLHTPYASLIGDTASFLLLKSG